MLADGQLLDEVALQRVHVRVEVGLVGVAEQPVHAGGPAEG